MKKVENQKRFECRIKKKEKEINFPHYGKNKPLVMNA
jgi:hypothetical protein